MLKNQIVSIAIAVALACTVILASSVSAQCEPTWIPTFGSEPGVNGTVRALAVFDDGAGDGPALYAGGHFTTAGGVTVNGVAKWDGAEWSALGVGVIGGVSALAVFDDGAGGGPALYAGGDFVTAGGATVNRIAKWDGATWSALGDGMSSTVWSLTVFDDGSGSGPALYAGGVFATAGGVTVNRIARWDGAAWSGVGSGMDSRVAALTVFDDGSGGGPSLYAGGWFTTAGGMTVNHIARWDGAQWSSLGSGISGRVEALTVFDDLSGGGPALYAGGDFTTAGGAAASRIAKWDGAAWSSLGSGISSTVYALAVFDDGSGSSASLYAGGDFTTAGGAPAERIAKWDGAAWSALDGGMVNGSVLALTVFDAGSRTGPAMCAGGDFPTIGGLGAKHIAKWDGGAWSALGSAIGGDPDPRVYSLITFDDGSGDGPALYAGGSFTTAGGVSASRIARWDGFAWSALGSGLSNAVSSLAVFDDGSGGGPALYAGGQFGGSIAKWDGALWSSFGGGMSPVRALAVFDDGSGPALYAGGQFSSAGGISASRIAKWDGAAWSPLGLGMDDYVNALTVFDDGSGGGPALYAGGEFSTAGGVIANHIAKWDGSAWSRLDSGMGGGTVFSLDVRALAVFDDGSGGGPALYAGGDFTVAGGVPAHHIAKWDGTAWSALGSGMNERVWTLTVFDDGSGGGPALYACGGFTVAGGVEANRIAKWDGAAWSALGEGMQEFVYAMTAFVGGRAGGPVLYAGGQFTMAGGVSAHRIAKWGCESAPCYADCDLSGALDFFDFLCFQNFFAAGEPEADCDESGELDFFDFLCFQNAFAAGCE